MRHKKFNLSKLFLIAISFTFLLGGCSLFGDPKKDNTANDYIYSSFKEWYLWYDQIPEIDPNDYESYSDLINAIKVEQDRWSIASSLTAVKKLFESGEYTGFGGGFMKDYDGKIKLTKVYTNSPLGRINAQRGWVVESVNNYTVSNIDKVNETLNSLEPVEFVLTDLDGNTNSYTLQREAFNMNTVLYSNVYTYAEKRIGYFVFDSFLESSEAELEAAIKELNDQNITDLIVDLRYNGGGLNTIAEMLIGAIGGAKVDGQVIAEVTHNDKKTDNNRSTVSEYDGIKLNIDKVYFLITNGTASASELLINCLTPFMDVKLVGSTTHGKPVGMYILSVEKLDLAILPISFKNVNHDGYGDYYNGFDPNIEEIDDLSHNWGDTEELMLKTAINDIVSPATTAAISMKSGLIKQQKQFEYKGLNQIFNAY